jgi:hypothetical protein
VRHAGAEQILWELDELKQFANGCVGICYQLLTPGGEVDERRGKGCRPAKKPPNVGASDEPEQDHKKTTLV